MPMPATDSAAHHRALAAFVAEHRPALEAHADSDKESARLAEALLRWDRAAGRPEGGQR